MTVTILGSINMDVVLSTPSIALPGETLSASAKNLYSGGKGANQAIAAARMQVPVKLLGAVGDDAFGETLKKGFAADNIDLSHLETLKNTDTGQAYICVSADGENTVIVVPGANHDFKFSRLPSAPSSGSNVYLSQFEMPLAEISKFLKAASGGTRIINAAPALIEGKSLFADAEIIIVNETELASFTGHTISEIASADEIDAAATSLLSRDDQWIVVTLGSKGAHAISRAGTISVPGYKMHVLDTTGAGDCFCGVLAASLAQGVEMQTALTRANAAAALAVTKPGAGPSMPSRQDVLDLTARIQA